MFKLNQIVPWGRSFNEYVKMFGLDEADLRKKIICCADGPASFNASMKKRGLSAVSCDPIYVFSAIEIKKRIKDCFESVKEQTMLNKDKYCWTEIKSVDELGKIRMRAMVEFLKDYEQGKEEGRYIAQSLPRMSFPQDSFDIALCSHFLFLYSSHLSLDFHIQSVLDMMRIAGEARIFPLLDLNGDKSPYIDPLVDAMIRSGYRIETKTVGYEFQCGANKMMRIFR